MTQKTRLLQTVLILLIIKALEIGKLFAIEIFNYDRCIFFKYNVLISDQL